MGQLHGSALYDGAQRIGSFLLTNLITACLLMTVVGAPFGLLGLFAVMNEWVQGRQPEIFRVYSGAIRRHWRTAAALGIIDVLLGGIFALNFSIFPAMGLESFPTIMSLVLTACCAALLLIANLYAWTVMSLFSLPLRGTIKLSLLLALSRPFRSLLITLATLLPLIASLVLPIAFLLIVSLSVAGYVAARGVWWVLQLHFTREELAELMADADDSP